MSPAPADVRLVVSDIDGTLVDPAKVLTPPTIAAVARLRAAGIGFTVISARPMSGISPIAEALALDQPMGAFNGGTIFRRDGSVLAQHRLDPATVAAAFALADGIAPDCWLFADDIWYASTDRGAHVGNERIAANQAPVVTADFASLYDRVDKLTFVSDAPQVLAELSARAAALSGQVTIVQSQPYYLDVTAAKANKGDGIAALADAIGVPLAQVLAIGDQANDLPMFARAGNAVAMGQAPAAVRAKAGQTTTANDADGVAAAIALLLREPAGTR